MCSSAYYAIAAARSARDGFCITLILVALLAALSAPELAAGATASPTMQQVVTWAAGHPTTITCDADANQSPVPAPPGTTATAWTVTGGNLIHAHPAFCAASTAAVGTTAFAGALDVFLHEAARAHGWRKDSCVELFADMAVYDALRRFYGVGLFTPMSQLVGSQVLADTRTLPAVYQPEPCWSAGTMR